MPYFVFVEFREPRINAFLSGLRSAFDNQVNRSPIHVTIRGPYAKAPSASELQEFSDTLRGHGVRISGAGNFSTPTGFAVFARAECSAFKELWHKPDFKVAPTAIHTT